MLKAYEEDKDLYALIGSKCFNNNYEDNLEFNPITHELQPDGKKRRSAAKAIQLAISYNMGTASLAERIKVSKNTAKKIIDDFYIGFPGVKKFTDESKEMLKNLGYVTDMYGRRRHLPDAILPQYQVFNDSINAFEFNPLLGSSNKIKNKDIENKIAKFESDLSNLTNRRDVYRYIDSIKSQGFSVVDNSSKINRAMRQCLNARIQATAASMTKRAMILIDSDERLKRLNFNLLITVHDEIFGECPKENAKEVASIISELMVKAAKEKCSCKFKCDSYIVSAWYEDELYAEIKKDLDELRSKKVENIESVMLNKYSMVSSDILLKMIDGSFECGVYNYI